MRKQADKMTDSTKNNKSVSAKVADRVYPPKADYGGAESIIFRPASKRSEDPQQADCRGDSQETKYDHKICKTNPILRITRDKKMQNEPNFTTNAPTKHAKDAKFTQIPYSLLQLFTRQLPTFAQKCKKARTFRHFLPLSINDTLNSMYNKDLHKILPA